MTANTKIRIGDWLLDANSNRLIKGGETVALEPLAAQVLESLAAKQGEVVSTDELVEAHWPGKFVGDGPVYRIIADLRRALGDDAQRPRYIETIRKRGYKLVADTSVESAAVDGSIRPGEQEPRGDARRRTPMVVTIVVLAAVAMAVYWFNRELSTPIGPQTIAVLPFEDLSADGQDAHIGDGIAEVLIHQLSQVEGLNVIARNSSFAFKGRNVDIRKVGDTLGASSVLEGSVQRGDGSLRIAAQLIDADSGNHVWSKLFDVSAENLFAVQDDIAAVVVEALLPSAAAPASANSAPPGLDAYEMYLLGRHKVANLETPAAIDAFRRAIELDSEFGLAYSGLADALLEGVYLDAQGLDKEASLESARSAIDKAIELAPERAEPYASRLLLASLEYDRETADASFEAAIARDPSYVNAHVWYLEDLLYRAWFELDKNYLDRAISRAETARQIDPLNARLKSNLAYIARLNGDYALGKRLLIDIYELSETTGDAAQALSSLGFLHLETESLDKAVAYFQLARRMGGDDIGVYTTYLARAYLLLQEYESARYWLDQIDKPFETEPLFNHLDLLLLSGNDDQLLIEVDAMLARDDTTLLPREEALSFAVFFLGNSGRCDRLVEITAQMDLDAYRVRQPAADCLLAWCYRKVGAEDKALEHIEHSRDYVRRVQESGIVTVIDLYVAASLHALEGDRDATLTALRDAYDAGMRAPDFVARDEVVGQFRDDERFQQLLADMRRDVETMRKRVFNASQNDDWYSLVDVQPLENLH